MCVPLGFEENFADSGAMMMSPVLQLLTDLSPITDLVHRLRSLTLKMTWLASRMTMIRSFQDNDGWEHLMVMVMTVCVAGRDRR